MEMLSMTHTMEMEHVLLLSVGKMGKLKDRFIFAPQQPKHPLLSQLVRLTMINVHHWTMNHYRDRFLTFSESVDFFLLQKDPQQ